MIGPGCRNCDERQHRLSRMRERERDRIRKGSETLLRERMRHTRRDSDTDGERQQRLSRIRDNSLSLIHI